MVEGFPVCLGDDEAGIAFGLRPVERERDLVGPLLHSAAPVWFVAGCGAGAGWAG